MSLLRFVGVPAWCGCRGVFNCHFKGRDLKEEPLSRQGDGGGAQAFSGMGLAGGVTCLFVSEAARGWVC